MALTQITTDGIKDGTITGTDLTTNVDLVDNQKLRLGTSNDLQIYHSGSASIIQDTGDGNIKIISNKLEILNAANNEYMAVGNQDGNFELYFNGSKKFETVTGGATITGVCTATSFAGDGSSLSGINTDLVSDTSPQLGGALDTNGSNINFGDSTSNGVNVNRLTFGTATNGDLALWHDGSNSYIVDQGTGELRIRGAEIVRIQDSDSAENMAVFNKNGSVELYHNNSKKFETASYGAVTTGTFQATGNIEVFDNGKFIAGTGADLQIYHDPSSNKSIIKETGSGSFDIQGNWVQILNEAGNETKAIFKDDGAVELYYDNSKKFETTSAGVTVTGDLYATNDVIISSSGEFFGYDNAKLVLGHGRDLQIFHNGSASYIQDVGTGNLVLAASDAIIFQNSSTNETLARFYENGGAELYHDNVKRITTRSGGNAQDGAVIYGNSSNVAVNFFTNTTERGSVYANSSNQIGFLDETGNWSVNFDRGSNCYLTGHWLPESNNTYDLGSSSYRWRNIYTNDLNLSNEGSSNDVDGTWGSYTIQEGAEDLFLVNKRSGKKYKFNLTEVN